MTLFKLGISACASGAVYHTRHVSRAQSLLLSHPLLDRALLLCNCSRSLSCAERCRHRLSAAEAAGDSTSVSRHASVYPRRPNPAPGADLVASSHPSLPPPPSQTLIVLMRGTFLVVDRRHGRISRSPTICGTQVSSGNHLASNPPAFKNPKISSSPTLTTHPSLALAGAPIDASRQSGRDLRLSSLSPDAGAGAGLVRQREKHGRGRSGRRTASTCLWAHPRRAPMSQK